MNKPKIYLLFQDCAFCHDAGERAALLAAKHQVELVKVPFYTKAGKHLIKAASLAGFKSLPVFWDGSKYAYKLDDLLTSSMAKKARKKGAKDVTKK